MFAAVFLFFLLTITTSLVVGESNGGGVRILKKKSKKSKKSNNKGSSNENTLLYLTPGQSIQKALDDASDDTTIYLSPGDYVEEENSSSYGLRISKNGIKLVGSTNVLDNTGITRIIHNGGEQQLVGVYAAPEGCEFENLECDSSISDFSIEGIVVEGFPANGIQTRFVDGFKFLNCKSVSNLRNGLYATLSKNGIVQGCASVGSLDSGLWVAGSEQVHVLDNTLSDSITGLEVTVSKDLYIANNNVFNNVVGIGMYHANMAGTFPDFLPSNWVIENNRVFNNNRVNDAPAGTFQAALPNGYGILIVGVRDVTIMNNIIVGNKNVGLSMAGFCEVQQLVFQADCTTGSNAPIDGDPSANDNIIVGNMFDSNGEIGLPALNLPGADIAYVQSAAGFLKPNNNCFENNISPYGKPASFFATDFESESMVSLPTTGCAPPA